MAERIPCPHCSKSLHDRNAVYQHLRAKHGGKGQHAYRDVTNAYRTDREPSMADLFVKAQINRAMGIQNDDWLEEMVP